MLTNIARLVASQAHAGQVRKYTNEPYVNHPERVSAWLSQFHVGEVIEAAALCHDVLEDCDVSYSALEMTVGTQVADLVQEVTNGVYPEGTPRIEKYWGNILKLLQASHQAQTLKCGDIYDNCKDVYDLDPSYAARYIAEKFFLVRSFTRAQGDVRDATLNLLSEIYNGMSDGHKIYCLEYIQQIGRECPDDMVVRFHNIMVEANTYNGCTLRIGDNYGTAPASV
ncbi:metal-dependent phosphohydrolase [Erwinia phage pEa_SNUABM_2]|uniref:HD domain-containing protein n=1 Tax=Erwinia phage pEa_SNUABM_2 TaxID=2869547 RepID=A0AAE8C1G0_9CAUD|nr:metal-dependent phosphohydrolase [Erwinia phage pEa_SNUABM_2]QZE59307.1 hypothetical protein pEaSNUABM2_00063 [Erwinia phage pEa_SNUABM_2]